ncbi:hypothetical protein B1759_10185 [Rubrivirga sp. SAORIC476]|uniref:DUF7005 family protein n=1 Tax=Rubrivirga sp. SAORIC476 TaxID=1961794 RepID=UPI000BA98889|nr:hypothetical protein [Rubrivirga sp. SAORIC476]PAP81658.1 hypothetical protein B1759_10185 [Rubrivirga sp. SAORIC476]
MMLPSPPADLAHRTDRLRRLGAAEADLDTLLAYTDSPFTFSGPQTLDDEPFVSAWEGYLAEAEAGDVFAVLQQAIVQLRFPVRAGIGDTEVYRAATRRGDLAALGPDGLFEGGLQLVAPDRLRLELQPTPAGRIPVLTAPVREDFVALLQALTRRNEPVPIPASMGALMVSGYNNWDRVRRYRRTWEASGAKGSWEEAFQALIPHRARYQDRFVLLSEGPYAGVAASALGVEEDEWIQVSHVIRREHECAHYYTRRVLGAMTSNAFEEMMADAYGVTVATGRWRPDAVRRLLGLADTGGRPLDGGRIWNYQGSLRPDAFAVVVRLVDEILDGLDVPAEAGASAEAAHLLRHLAAECYPSTSSAREGIPH